MYDKVNYIDTGIMRVGDLTPTVTYTTCASSFPFTKKENKMYLSGDFDINGKKIYIKEVLYNNPVTVVFWNDGTKTVTKCQGGDVYSKETGLAICVLKKLTNPTKVRNLFADWIQDDKQWVSIKDVRKKFKDAEIDKRETSAKAPEQTTFENLSNITFTPETNKKSRKNTKK